VRWQNLTIEAEASAALPGYRDPAVVRHFDAPEALGTRFYEVRAKSAINRVPERSRMPFRWTINPYRGCAHACVYCLRGDTPILMADGRTRPLSELAVGDQIVGTERRRTSRRYVTTEVLAAWSTIKLAHRVALEDGTELITSGDHRFLTLEGWKHVAGVGRRTHVAVDDELLGTGGFALPPAHSDDYRRGYLCGQIRGAGEATRDVADIEALRRARQFLATAGVPTDELEHASVDRTGDLIAWPVAPTDDWRKGFLAGIFDAQGSCDDAALRIAAADGVVHAWTAACLDHLGFVSVEELTRPLSIRIGGGLRERLRFLHLTDPAITRKRTVRGMALDSDATTRVTSVEPMGIALRLFDITTGTGDFIADGIVSHNCFARPTHKYLDMDAGRDFERQIVVKVNVPEVLRAELARPSWRREHVAMGTNTDPYQWVEGRYKLMRGIWAALRDAANPCSVLTKSPLLLRDLDLMREIAQVAPISANLSVPTIDERAWRASEPHTPNPRARLEAVGELNRAGIPTGILIAPLMPGINDDPRQVQEILDTAVAAGATSVGGIALHLRGEVRGIFMEWLRSYRPDLVEHYEELYARGAYAPRAEQDRLSALVRQGRRQTPFRRDPRRVAPPAPLPERPPPPQQDALF
jgi:DNA repair photolyase